MSSQNANEFDFIDWIRAQTPAKRKRIEIDIGDVACALSVAGQKLVLVTADMLLEGTHFDLSAASPRQVGRKAVAVSLSDVAAMGVSAAALIITVGLKRGISVEFASELYRGMAEQADRFDVPIAGGDVTSWTDGLAISVTALGIDGGLEPVRRSGARTDDVICVTGELGGSLLGRHMEFVPRLTEGITLNRNYELHSMIDLSDGLAADLRHIIDESGVGVQLLLDAIPVSADARLAAERSGRSAIQHALTDGEDFELLFTLAESEAERLLNAPPFPTTVTRIGRIVSDGGLRLLDAAGRERSKDLKVKGYEHNL